MVTFLVNKKAAEKQLCSNIFKREPANGFQKPSHPSHPSHKLEGCLRTPFEPFLAAKCTKAKPNTALAAQGGTMRGRWEHRKTHFSLTI